MSFLSFEFFSKIYQFFYFQTWSWGFWTPPDRKFLKEELLPYFGRQVGLEHILFVGVRRYTKSYSEIFSRKNFVTIDSDPKQASYGSGRHEVVDVCSHVGGPYDLVVLNGVIGFGLNHFSQVRSAIENLSRQMSQGAWFVLGVRPQDFTEEMNSYILEIFERAEFPPLSQSHLFFSDLLSGSEHHFYFFKSRRRGEK